MRALIRVSAVLAAFALAVTLDATATPLLAQAAGTVRGTVTAGTTMRPLSGAQVMIPGTGRGTLTNNAGEFLLVNVPAGTRTVRVQMIGYATEERQVTVGEGEAATLDFQLRETAIALDEVVVTGTAGATQRRAIGNTVSTVNAEKLTESAPIATVQELLTARTPGLTLMSSSGQAGSSSRIRIRGAGSLSAGLEPVFYVDGIRVYSGTASGYSVESGIVQGTNPLDAINPDDIESIEVIKGPAAATLYGADAAGGVVQIITKKGRGTTGIQWTASLEAGRTDWHLDNPINYWLCQPQHIADPAVYPGCAQFDPNSSAETRLLVQNPLKEDPAALRTGDVLGVNLSARGGGDRYNYYLSFENHDEQGVFYNNFSKRTGGRANFGFVPSDQLNFTANVGYARNDIRMPLNNNSSDGILRNAFRGRPGLSAPWKEGWRGLSPEIANEYDNQTQTERTTIGLTTNFNPFSWFQNRLTLGLDKNDRLNRLFYTIDRTGRQPWGATNAPGAMYRYLPVTHVWTADYAGTITNQFTPDISSSSSAGMQLNSRRFEAHETIGQGLVANRLNLISAAATTRASQEFEEQTSLGFFVQEQIGWRNRLFGTVAVRVDDNSAFGQEFSVVVYPKASLSYVISDEPFFNLRGVESLRLRTAWGRAGNAPAPFSADRTFAAAVTTVGDVSVNQLQAASYGNPNLKAETGEELELGFDASLFAGRLGLEFTYYNQRTKDALVSVPNPPSTGFGSGGPSGYCCSHFINVGEIANSGLELLLTGTPLSLRDVSWETTLSLATNRNRLVSFGGAREEITFGAFASVQRHREGYPLGGFWAVDVQRDAQGQPILQNGNVVVDFDNEIFMGSMLPTREIGLTNTLTLFGNLRLFANVDYKGGNYQWCAICSVRNRIDLNTWEVNNPSADPVDVLVWRSLQTLTHIMPADFLKLREVSVTYTLPTTWSQAFRSERASLSLSGRNLWMWTRYEGTSDPEVTFYSTSNFTHLDYASTPMTRRMMASLRLAF